MLDSGAHDVFLFNGVSPDMLPAALKQDVLARVAQGKGLVLVGVKERGRLDPPLENDPDRVALDEPLILDAPVAQRAEAGDPEAELFAVKQGRAARLPAAPVTDYAFGWKIPYDHWQERLGWTAAWAHAALAGLGVTLELGKGNPPPVMAAYEMAVVPYTTRIRVEKDEQGWIKPLPWNQEPEFEGAGGLERGDDLEGIVRTNGFWTPYPGSVDQVLRGIAPRDFPYANWMGYAKDIDSRLDNDWEHSVTGGSSG